MGKENHYQGHLDFEQHKSLAPESLLLVASPGPP